MAKNNDTHREPCSSTIYTAEFDGHTGKGQSDAPGDLLRLAGTQRKGACRDNWVIGYEFNLESTPRARPANSPNIPVDASHQRDTGVIAATVGRELPIGRNLDGAIYGTVGVLNGSALEAAVALKNEVHRIGGLDDARRSPASTPGTALVRFSGRLDSKLGGVTFNNDKLVAQLVGTAGLNLGTDRREAMAAAYLWLGENTKQIFHPSLPGMPMPDNRGSGIAAGIRGNYISYDASTRQLGTRTTQLSTEIAAVVNLGKLLAHGSVTYDMTNVVRRQVVPATPTVRLGLTLPF